MTRYGRSARRSVLTSPSGTFSTKLAIPRRGSRRRASSRIVIGVRVLGTARLKRSLPGGQGTVR